jgi:hypothetical protein
MVRRESNLSARHSGPTFIFQNQFRKTSSKSQFLNALLPKRLQKYSGYFYRARLKAKFLKIIFQASCLVNTPLICGAQRYQLHFYSHKLFEKIFPKRFRQEKMLR